MKQEELTKAITEGIDKSLPVLVLKCLIGVILAFEIIILGFAGYVYYTQDDSPPQLSMALEPSCFPYENLRCHGIVGNSTYEFDVWSLRICGYQEANALFKHMKPRYEEEIRYNNQKYNENFELKGWECD